MKLNVDFGQLYAAVARMGAAEINFDLNLDLADLELIDIELGKGIEVNLEEIDNNNSLLSYEGRQVLLYIQDHGGKVLDSLENGSKGNKYHVADCRTLGEMRSKKRFERYVVTNDLTEDFFISGEDWQTKKEHEGHTKLKVCKNCLTKLNYQGYSKGGSKSTIFKKYDLEEFFSTYSSFFTHKPSQFAGVDAKNNYSSDWNIISGRYKASKQYKCEGSRCGLDLSNNKHLMHVHHVSGVKKNNNESNLLALCIECHRQQPCHGHMFVSHEDRKTITRLRREQSKLKPDGWNEVYILADPGIHGLLKICQKERKPIPEIGFEIQASNHEIVAELELGWPKKKFGVAINESDIKRGTDQGWEVWEMAEALDQLDVFLNRF